MLVTRLSIAYQQSVKPRPDVNPVCNFKFMSTTRGLALFNFPICEKAALKFDACVGSRATKL
jgi:hypothetical protein